MISPQTIVITNLEDNLVEGAKTMELTLLNPQVCGAPSQNSQVLLFPTNATNYILDDDFYGSPAFVAPNFNVLQSGGQVLITVVRSGAASGTISVNYATSNGSNAPVPFQPALAAPITAMPAAR